MFSQQKNTNTNTKSQGLFKNFTMILNQITDSDQFRGLNSTAKTLYYTLRKYSNAAHKPCWPSNKILTNDLNCSERTITRAFTDLKKSGLIKAEMVGKRRLICFLAPIKVDKKGP